jgi:hypothetical protein
MGYAIPIRGVMLGAMLAFSTTVTAQQPPTGEKPVGTTGTTSESNDKDKKDEQPRPDPMARPSGFVAKARAWGEKQYERVSRFTKPMNDKGFTPEILTLGQGSGLAAGLTWKGEQIGGSPIDLETFAGYSYRGYELYDMRIGLLRDRKARTTLRTADSHIASQFDASKQRVPGLGLYGHLQYRHSPRHRYWGEGPDSEKEDASSFLMRGGSYEMVAEYQRSNFFGFAVRGGILDIEVGPGEDGNRPDTQDLFNEATAPGLRRQPAFAHLAGGMTFDTRDAVGSPRSGGVLGLLTSRFHAINPGPEDLSFSRVAIDGRYFLPASSRSVVALRLLASRDFGDSGGRVPFYLQQTLGGGDVMRGFDRARFRDTALMTVSAEYRFDVHKNVELAAFGDAGQVAPSFSALAPGHFETSWGVGVRAKHKRNVLFRTDAAWSREGLRFIFSAGPVF